MKKIRIAILAVIVTAIFVTPFLYMRGLLWKKNLYITTPERMCPVHKVILKKEMIRAHTWVMTIDQGPEHIEMDRLFPLKNNLYLGGHRPNVGMFEREYCSECREGAHTWYSNYRKAEQVAPRNR